MLVVVVMMVVMIMQTVQAVPIEIESVVDLIAFVVIACRRCLHASQLSQVLHFFLEECR